MYKVVSASFVAFTFVASGSVAQADEMGTRNWKDWDVTLGIGAMYEPVSPGVDETEVGVLPYVDIEYKDRLFIKSERGIGGYLLRSQDDPEYGVGLAIGYDGGRDEDDAETLLQGLGDLEGSAEAVLFFEGELGPVELDLEIAQGLNSDGHDGLRAEFGASLDGMVTDKFYLSAGPFLTYGDDNYTQSYYGVSSTQAARSNLYNQYDASGGIESYGFEVEARYAFTKNWSVLGFAGYTQLTGDAKDSPFVTEDGFFSAGIAAAYTF